MDPVQVSLEFLERLIRGTKDPPQRREVEAAATLLRSLATVDNDVQQLLAEQLRHAH